MASRVARVASPRGWRSRLLLALLGTLAGLLLAGVAFLVMHDAPWTRPPATNGLVPELLEPWRADPTFFERRDDHWHSRHPFMPAQEFAVVKEPGALRVFVLGSSQAMGDPYVHARTETEGLDLDALRIANSGGIATWLEEYLRMLHPKRAVQVINAAVGSQDLTTTALVFAEVAAKGEPDLVVILDGNNESFNVRYEDADALRDALGRLTPRFAAALASIRATAEQRRIATIVLTVPTNVRDWLPSQEGQSVAKVELDQILASERWQEGLRLLDAAGASEHAMHAFFEGRSHEFADDREAAWRAYVLAKDRDGHLIRTHSEWNDAVRQSRGAFLQVLDLEAIARSWSPRGLPGFDLFHDHCHFRVEANVRAAREIALFHQRQAGLPDQELPLIDARERMRDNLQVLYAIKERKWRRLQESPEFAYLGDANADAVARQFRAESDAIERMIRVRAADLGEPVR